MHVCLCVQMERVNPKDVGPEKDLLDSDPFNDGKVYTQIHAHVHVYIYVTLKDLLDSDPFNDGKVHRKRSVGARTSTSVHVYVHLDMCVYLYVCVRVCICIHDIDQFKCT